MSRKVLLVGSGGREHALAWKLAQSSTVSKVLVVPGNGGTVGLKVQNVTSVKQDDFPGLLDLAVKENIDLVIPGPEAPLVDGITDFFRENGPARISVFGPSKAAARMEGSKAFSKDFMKRHHIPTAGYENFSDHAAAQAYLDSIYSDRNAQGFQVVIKASGLAAGKGVILPETYEQARKALASIMLDKEFGDAGDSVVIEEFMEGEEISILSFSDGHSFLSLPAAQDHKRIFDGDRGGNTGGMGAYAPATVATPEIMQQIQHQVLQPTIDGMRKEGYPFVGCLFTGFMLTSAGPKVLEYNVRFGDPECQTLLPLLNTDLADLMLACTNNHLDSLILSIKPGFSTTVVIAAGGYPGSYAKGTPMTVSLPSEGEDIFHFHAGTTSSDNSLTTSGGRVIASTALAPTCQEARDKAYKGVSLITFDSMQHRSDIAYRELLRQQNATNGSSSDSKPLTYASTGVSITAGNDLVTAIKPHVLRTKQPGASAIIGGFGGDFSLPLAGYPEGSPTIVAAIDGIGTKLMIALECDKYDTVGIDLVAMNVNDLIVQAAKPLMFLDYYACGRLNVPAAVSFIKGVAEGCIEAGCTLVGGETAEMPGVYRVHESVQRKAAGAVNSLMKGVNGLLGSKTLPEDAVQHGEGEWDFKSDFDGAGCAIGALRAGQKVLPDKDAMKPGDVLLGLASSGAHSNGFSLIRKIVERSGLSYTEDKAPWDEKGRSVGEALLEPTRIYVKSLLAVLEKYGESDIKGLAHITGGGLTENIPRMLPATLAAKVEIGSWTVPPVLVWVKNNGGLENAEFARTLNTGLGMVMVVNKEKAEVVSQELRNNGETVFTVGELVEKTGEEEVILQGVERWNAL